jgi:hypothetical protein
MTLAEKLLSLPSFEFPLMEPAELWRRQSGWHASDLVSADWTIEIPPVLVRDIRTRAANAESIEAAAAGWKPDASAAALQKRIEVMLEGGIGFCRMRGFELSGNAEIDRRAILLLGLLFGRPVSQTKNGNFLVRVEDLGHNLRNPKVRGHQTAAELAFHCDRADRVLLLCVRPAFSGGHSRVVSSIILAQKLQTEAPELVQQLFQPLPQDCRGEEDFGKRPFCQIPIFSNREGIFVARYIRRFIEDSQRHSQAPRLSAIATASLNLLDDLITREGMALEMPFEPGDVQILNNNVILHSRTAFKDHFEPQRHRLLLRLWLAHASARPLPHEFADLYGVTEAGAYRGGVWPNRQQQVLGSECPPAVSFAA